MNNMTMRLGLGIILLFVLAAIYAPLLAAGKPLVVVMDGTIYFPLGEYLFYSGYYTKGLDLFFNLLMITFPLFVFRKTRLFAIALQIALLSYLIFFPLKNPQFTGAEGSVTRARLYEQIRNKQVAERRAAYGIPIKIPDTSEEVNRVTFILWPLIREFHWEEDAESPTDALKILPFWEIARPNQKDLIASLLFGIRIALTVGVLSEAIALLIAIPLGAVAGYFGGLFDLILLRLVEIWESMPLFFMLLFLISILETKSIFQVIFAIAFFGWTTAARYLRAEIFREKGLPYVETAKVMRFSDAYIIRRHILPNALVPLVALIPFSILQAISAEAGLSFLGLGEENSPSWGVIMDEARQLFPQGIALMWPPAILLTLLLVAIALVGDGIRDALDPKKTT